MLAAISVADDGCALPRTTGGQTASTLLTTLDASGHTASTGRTGVRTLTAPTKRSMDGSLSRLGPPDEALEVARLVIRKERERVDGLKKVVTT